MGREQIEKVKEYLEKTKISANIQDGVLYGASISGQQVVSLSHQIDELYSAHEHEILTSYVSLNEAHQGVIDGRNGALEEIDQLIKRLEAYYKAADSTEKAVVSRIREEFNILRTPPKTKE
jgi:hypothetical protein